ncbi:hypothetical protein [Actinoplanes sp. L3-i22]|uniref:hypothetical protein n=1 Tax=Actinoplanes sp. L3-i22 TaxID=2836373 RepID=UPI001C85EC8A|nr:hypothetical protein [Actinoplanes sp. L3-i22]
MAAAQPAADIHSCLSAGPGAEDVAGVVGDGAEPDSPAPRPQVINVSPMINFRSTPTTPSPYAVSTARANLAIMTTMELATFRIHDGAEEALLAERPAMLAALRTAHPACLAAYLTKNDDGTWTDIILWRTRTDADESARTIMDIPECAAWFRHLSETLSMRHADVTHAWPTH